MELRDLRALVAIVETGSFTAGAARLGYTQSAISQQVQSLERDVGQVLLERRPLKPTPAGARLIEHARRILMRVDVAHAELSALETDGPVLRITAGPLAAPSLLADALRLIRRDAPSVRIELASAPRDAAVGALASGEADVALVDGITAPDNPLALAEPGLLVATGLLEEELAVAMPASHPLAGRRWVDLTMLADAPWVTTWAVPETAARAGQRFSLKEPADLTMILALVAADLGSALLPVAGPALPPGVTVVPLRRPALVHRTEVLTRRDPPAAAATLVVALRDLARDARRTPPPAAPRQDRSAAQRRP